MNIPYHCSNLLVVIHFKLQFNLEYVSTFRETIREDEIPSNMRAEAGDRRQELIEYVSNVDDTLGEMFLG